MSNLKIRVDFDEGKLIELGYRESMMEGGYISKDAATIINIYRSPYKRQIMQYRDNVESEHLSNLKQLIEIDQILYNRIK